MARQKNDGRGRMGGRDKGTPNKVTMAMKDWLSAMIDENREQMIADLAALELRDRLMMLERFMAYVIPKQQSIKADVGMKNEGSESIVERLKRLAEENDV